MPNSPRGWALRKCRYSEQGRIYLVTTVTSFRRPVFSDLQCGRLLVDTLRKEFYRARTLAYVVMPDHLHWLVQLETQVPLASLMRTVKSVSARKVNRYINGDNRVWQAGYHDHALRREEDLVKVARYLVANPLRAGLVATIGDYPLWDAIWL